MYKISFISVTLNNKVGLERTLNSYIRFKEKYYNSELIIIDGLSSDGTKSFLDKNSNIIDYFLSEKDLGIYDAMNKGIKLFSGDFVCFMNSGDEILVEGMVDLVSNLKVGYCHSGKVVWDSEINSFNYLNYQPLLLRLPIHQAMVIHKELIHFFDLKYPIASDIDQKLNIVNTGRLINHNILVAKCESGGISQSINSSGDLFLRANEIFQIANKHFGVLIGILNYFKFIIWHSYKLIKSQKRFNK
jgi:glycosyltransferase involved in cell wall biosynthesis